MKGIFCFLCLKKWSHLAATLFTFGFHLAHENHPQTRWQHKNKNIQKSSHWDQYLLWISAHQHHSQIVSLQNTLQVGHYNHRTTGQRRGEGPYKRESDELPLRKLGHRKGQNTNKNERNSKRRAEERPHKIPKKHWNRHTYHTSGDSWIQRTMKKYHRQQQQNHMPC